VAIFRSFSEIVNSIRERLKLTQPNLDTKPGTVARDLFIDIQADQIERLHSSLLLVSQKQSPEQAVGRDLDKWARNFGISRRPGSPANGIVVFTLNSISTDVPIPSGTVVTARNGLQYKTIGNFVISVAERNKFAAIASRLRGGLNVAGITDSFAIEVPVQATRSGSIGNLSTLQIIEHNLEDAIRITNLTAFNGGSNLESDAAFRSRIFAVFSGANTGTAAGYRNASLSVSGVRDAIVIEPGNAIMLRDGTETIEINDGSFRILNSGTGGKVDIYILGSQLIEVVESSVYTDLSGSGNATDERNDLVPGLQGLDQTLTSEERRVQAFKTGQLPLQPISSVVSLIGSASGILAEKSTDSLGNVSGNFELIKDLNVETGGSPFGFDRIRFISSEKEVDAESIVKQGFNSVDPLRFSDIKVLGEVSQDIQITSENSRVSSADRSVITLNHTPVVNASRIVNRTTGEVYVIESQGIDENLGVNTTGEIIISGKTLPSTADILSTDYTWRLIFDRFIEYNGEDVVGLFKDESVADSVDWGAGNGIFKEESTVERTDDGFEFQVTTLNNISRVISVFSAVSAESTVSNVTTADDITVPGVVIGDADPVISNVISVTNSDGTELFATLADDGSFSGRTIILPSDSPSVDLEAVTVFYNKTEIFDIEDGDGSFSTNIITLPSDDILEGNELFDTVDDLFLTDEIIFVQYVADINEIVPSQSFTSLPINGAITSNLLLDSSLIEVTGSSQPVSYDYNTASDPIDINRFGPTRLSITTTGTTRSGRIKVTGTTLTRVELDITAGISINGLTFDLGADLRSALGLTTIPTNIGIARVDSVISVDDPEKVYDITGHELNNIQLAFKSAKLNTELDNTTFILPSTETNNLTSLSSGEIVRVSLLLYNNNDFEDLFFPGNNKVTTDRLFARIERISVSSGFRSTAGVLVGSMTVVPTSQPGTGLTYSASYNFAAPKEGERLTVRYNLNRLIGDVTVGVEAVRSITADVLVKEAPVLSIDVVGEIIVNENATANSQTILENAANSVVNLINSSVLGSTIDYSDILSSVTSVTGVDSANISLFNESGEIGRRTFIKALNNQNLAAGSVTFNAISRQDFRIT
jgi:uncharacterized phage protein gp47/JayE